MQRTDTLIRTKLRLPFIRPNPVSRPGLQARVAEGLCGPLTLITAPAGFGKTTLATACAIACGLPVAWLSLDKNDNQAGRFLAYLVATLQGVDERIGSEATQLLAGVQPTAPEIVLISLINDVDAVSGEIVLVLDDYQFVNSPAVHDQVAFLLEHCPSNLHLLIASRSDPALPLSRLRARGQVVELRTADLRFSGMEAAQFLNEVMGLSLDLATVEVLSERTEGWVAGLQMAALSMRNRTDIQGFIQEFSGTNRYILDYLIEEVLISQPPEVQHFLLYTSILERLSAPLCDAILKEEGRGMKDEAVGSGQSQREAARSPNQPVAQSSSFIPHPSAFILDFLERSNLFLIPLDDERTWYHYHHLFAGLLYARLQQSLKIQDIVALHTRAAQWYQHNGFTYEAIHHASLTSNIEWVEQLIEKNYMEMFHRGEASSMRFWTGKLSKELILKRPWLCIYEAQSHALFGQLDEADGLIAKAEEHLQSDRPSAETKSMLGHLSYIKSRVIGMRGDLNRAIELSLSARENTPASNQALHSGIGVMLGVGYFLNGDFPNATQAFNETIQYSIAAHAINGTVAAYCHLARLYAIQGHLQKSYELYREAGKCAEMVGSQNRGVLSLVDMGIASVLYERNDLENALSYIRHGLELIPLWGNADDIALAYTIHARIQLAQVNIAGAADAIAKGIHLIQTRGVFSEARDAVWATQIELWLAQGDFQSAGSWAASQEERLAPDRGFRFENELTRLTLSRVSIAQKKPDEAIRLLTRLEESAGSGGRTGSLIEILILKALTQQMLGETSLALAALEKSLSQAEPEGYIRVFINEGQPIQRLLDQWLAHAGASHQRDYAAHLLAHFTAQPQASAPAQKALSPVGSLVEPLSQRELEVLSHLASGRTNQEIAQQLVVSPGTVKAHTASIYRKLDVANRTEAVTRSRELGILR